MHGHGWRGASLLVGLGCPERALIICGGRAAALLSPPPGQMLRLRPALAPRAGASACRCACPRHRRPLGLRQPPCSRRQLSVPAAAAEAAAPEPPGPWQRALGWLCTGGAVLCAGGLVSTVFDNPPYCQLAVRVAQQDQRVAQAAGGAVSARWWGYDWEGQSFANRAAVTIPLDVAGAPPGVRWCAHPLPHTAPIPTARSKMLRRRCSQLPAGQGRGLRPELAIRLPRGGHRAPTHPRHRPPRPTHHPHHRPALRSDHRFGGQRPGCIGCRLSTPGPRHPAQRRAPLTPRRRAGTPTPGALPRLAQPRVGR